LSTCRNFYEAHYSIISKVVNLKFGDKVQLKVDKIMKAIFMELCIHVNSPTLSGRLPLSASKLPKIFLKIRGIFTN
jgi:hypothetical protein